MVHLPQFLNALDRGMQRLEATASITLEAYLEAIKYQYASHPATTRAQRFPTCPVWRLSSMWTAGTLGP
jgi:hypothetical protein